MSVIGEFTVPAESFALERTLEEHPGVHVRADRLATHSTEQVLPFLWASGDEADSFADAVADDPSVEEVTVAQELRDSTLLKLIWEDRVRDVINEMADQHAAIVEARGREGSWRLKLRFTEEGQVSSFQTHFDERGIRFEVHQLSRPSAARQSEFGLTPEQRDALVTALNRGYFEIPRGASMADLADELEVSENAVSQRIRRATANLVESTLAVDGDRNERD